MSNFRAIATVTATLREVLHQGVNADLATDVVTRPPDKVTPDSATNQMNLFLYKTSLNAAWRNQELPSQAKPGETGFPPLPLVLSYLLTAYGANDDEMTSHQLLGKAMSILHDQPLLDRARMQVALPGSDLQDQVESVKITVQPLSLDEMSKLWTTLQTQYRISAAYEASVVLIDSTRAPRSPLPVLTRGPGDAGVVAQPDTVAPFPTLESIEPPAALLGDEIRLVGHHLAGVTAVRLSAPRLEIEREVPPPPLAAVTDTEVRARVPDDPAGVPGGIFTVTAILRAAGEPDRLTNALALAVAPKITSNLPLTVARVGSTARIALTCRPQVWPDQQVLLLVGERQVAREAPVDPNAPTADLVFVVTDAPEGDFRLRLRVDGVDSLLIDRSGAVPAFDETQKVTIE
jgi:Pvc16 N-terminal domain